MIADGAFVRYRATGAIASVRDYSYLGGAHLLLSRGWVQVNASRYSPGDMPVLNASLQDRSGVFSAGEYDLLKRVRVFGGWETLDTNIHPTGTALSRPRPTTNRGFGGARLRLASRTTFSVRVEDGGRVTRPPVLGSVDSLFASSSDTGSTTAELQTSAGRITAFGRYTRRESVDSVFTSSTYTQHDSAAQLYVNLSRQTQLFGSATLTNNRLLDGTGNSYLQISGGGQQQLFTPGMWLRVEGTTSRTEDLVTGLLAPREAFSVGLNGQIARNTTIGLNVYADRAPVGFTSESSAWLTRSTLRVVHSIPTGSVRVANTNGVATRAGRGTGTVSGSVFADWNANGQPDAGEEVLSGIPVALGGIAAVTTGSDGQFSFLNVPSGLQQVRLDLNALPVDFDAAAGTDVSLEISRGETRRVSFGLLPLGGIRGRVFEDTNRNGQLDAGEPPVESAVLVLDGGQRSELARKGQFRFDAVRAGDHIDRAAQGLAAGGGRDRRRSGAPGADHARGAADRIPVPRHDRQASRSAESVSATRWWCSTRGVGGAGAIRRASRRGAAATGQHRTGRRGAAATGQHRKNRRGASPAGRRDAGRAIGGADRHRRLHDPDGGADRWRARPRPGGRARSAAALMRIGSSRPRARPTRCIASASASSSHARPHSARYRGSRIISG